MKHCQQEMTVIQNAWPVVCNFGWLIEADRNARKGKRYRAEVLNFTARLEDNLFTIQQGMMNGSYVLGPYRKLWVYVPKKRLVMALDYPDRIVQWSLYLYLNPLYDRLFIEDSYACRKGKGSHKAAKRLQSSKALPLTTAPSLRRRRGWNALASTSACHGLRCISATRIPLGSGAPTRTPTA